jgi:hypothetical protein
MLRVKRRRGVRGRGGGQLGSMLGRLSDELLSDVFSEQHKPFFLYSTFYHPSIYLISFAHTRPYAFALPFFANSSSTCLLNQYSSSTSRLISFAPAMRPRHAFSPQRQSNGWLISHSVLG